MIVRCPAKLNLFLAVGPPDHRGWHPLRTIFQTVSLYDELEVEIAESDSFSCDDPAVPEVNTVTRAWRLLAEVLTLPKLKVQLRKAIPAESGLGGGSSDAAAFLQVAQHLAGGRIPDHELLPIALSIGADVPFFLRGGRALGEGYGEILRPLPDAVDEHYVVARPAVGCATAEMYRALDQTPRPWHAFPASPALARGEYYNDFEAVAPAASRQLIDRLLALGAVGAALTGSGSAVFGRFSCVEASERAAQCLREISDHRAWAVSSLPRTTFW